MKQYGKILFLFALCFVGFFASAKPSHAAIALVQQNWKQSFAASTTITFNSSNTAGNLLIVSVILSGNNTSTYSDSLGNTAVLATTTFDAGNTETIDLYYIANCKGGSNTITVNFGASGASEIYLSEWSGARTSAPLDKIARAAAFAGEAPSTTAMTTTGDGELIFGIMHIPNVSGLPGAGFSMINTTGTITDEYEIQPTAGSVKVVFINGNPGDGAWQLLGATFFAAQRTASVKFRGGGVPNGTRGAFIKIRGGGLAPVSPSLSATYVQGCVASGGASSSSCTLGSNITAGNLLVVTAKADGTAPTPSITSSAGVSCTWNQVIAPFRNLFGVDFTVAQYYCNVPSSGSESVRVAWTSANSFSDIEVAEYSAPYGFIAGGLDQTATANNTGTTCSVGPTGALAQANELVVATCNTWNQAQTWGSVAGYTSEASSERNTSGWYDKSVTATTAVSWSKSIVSDNFVGIIGTFKLKLPGAGIHFR